MRVYDPDPIFHPEKFPLSNPSEKIAPDEDGSIETEWFRVPEPILPMVSVAVVAASQASVLLNEDGACVMTGA